jgi:hypothetical protein
MSNENDTSNQTSKILEIMLVDDTMKSQCVSKVCFVNNNEFDFISTEDFKLQSPAGKSVCFVNKNN